MYILCGKLRVGTNPMSPIINIIIIIIIIIVCQTNLKKKFGLTNNI